jgi:polyisoprenoid-binding protein YceI
MFSRAVLSSSLFLALSVPAGAFASTWTIDGAHADVSFSVRHMMVSNVKGSFTKVEGTVELDDKDVTKSKVSVTIDAKTVDTANAKRDEHLRGADFFDVEKFPTITFESTKVAKAKGGLKVTGNLTIHGVTKSVVLDVEGPTNAIKDPWGMNRRGLSASTKINRKDFGLTWNNVLEAGGVAVGDEVKISIEAELVNK